MGFWACLVLIVISRNGILVAEGGAVETSPLIFMFRTCCPYFQHAHFIPIVGVEKLGAYELVHGDLPRQHSFGTTFRFIGPVPADSRQ